jgi:hypothetical protein
MGFELLISFIDHLPTQLETTSNYSAIANIHILKTTAGDSESSPACSIFSSHFLVTASNSGRSPASALTPFPSGHRFTTEVSSERLAVYRQSFHIGAKRLKVHDQNFFH